MLRKILSLDIFDIHPRPHSSHRSVKVSLPQLNPLIFMIFVKILSHSNILLSNFQEKCERYFHRSTYSSHVQDLTCISPHQTLISCSQTFKFRFKLIGKGRRVKKFLCDCYNVSVNLRNARDLFWGQQLITDFLLKSWLKHHLSYEYQNLIRSRN